MIVLDTNVVSALLRRDPDRAVIAWLDGVPAESVWTTAITMFEVRFGLALLVASRRRRQLEEAFSRAVQEDLESRILPFDYSAAQAAGGLAAKLRSAGRPVEIRDTLIAGIVTARKATLATRNTKHFEGIDLSLVDPWSAS